MGRKAWDKYGSPYDPNHRGKNKLKDDKMSAGGFRTVNFREIEEMIMLGNSAFPVFGG